MFYADTPTGWGPQIGGPLRVWHYHLWSPVQWEIALLMQERVSPPLRVEEALGLPADRAVEVWT
jgi:hypothetical protein